MNSNPLYFVKVCWRGQCIMGGHWYAPTPSAAKQIAREKYLGNLANFPDMHAGYPALGACEIVATRSKAFANALNAEDA
jgi:hypothetical protein